MGGKKTRGRKDLLFSSAVSNCYYNLNNLLHLAGLWIAKNDLDFFLFFFKQVAFKRETNTFQSLSLIHSFTHSLILSDTQQQLLHCQVRALCSDGLVAGVALLPAY